MEEILKQLLMQRSQAGLTQAAQERDAFQQQLAMRERTRQPIASSERQPVASSQSTARQPVAAGRTQLDVGPVERVVPMPQRLDYRTIPGPTRRMPERPTQPADLAPAPMWTQRINYPGGGYPLASPGPGDVVSEAEGMRQYQQEKLTADPRLEGRANRVALGGDVADSATTDPYVMAEVLGLAGRKMAALKAYDERKMGDRRAAEEFRRTGVVDMTGVADNPSDPANIGDLRQPPRESLGRRLTPGGMVEEIPPYAPPPDERNLQMDDIVKAQGYFPELFTDMSPQEAAALIAGQLDARRRRELGAWDPSMMTGI